MEDESSLLGYKVYKDILEGLVGTGFVTAGSYIYGTNQEDFEGVKDYLMESQDAAYSIATQPNLVEGIQQTIQQPEFTAPVLIAGGFAGIFHGLNSLAQRQEKGLQELADENLED